MKKLIFAAIFILFSSVAWGANYYCDFEGSNGTGTQDNPFNSIANAMGSMSASDNLYCRGTATAEQTVSKGVNIYGNEASWLAYGGGNNQATVSNSSGDGIYLTSAADGALIDGFIITNPNDHGIYTEGAQDVEISNIIVTNAGATWIKLQPFPNHPCSGWSIHDSSFDTSGVVTVEDGYGIFTSYANSQDSNNLAIYNNIFKNNAEAGLRLQGQGISIYGNYFYNIGIPYTPHPGIQIHGNSLQASYDVYIYNNIFNYGDGSAIYTWCSVADGLAGEFYIQNNSFYNLQATYNTEHSHYNGYAIDLLGYGGMTKIVIKNNIIYNCGTTVADPNLSGTNQVVAMKVTGTLNNFYIYNNIIKNDNNNELIMIADDYSDGDSDTLFTLGEAATKFTNWGNNGEVVPGWVDTTPEDDVDDFKLSSSTANGAAGSSYPGDNCYSATREEGTNEYLYPDDYGGNTRQTSGDWDMGAHEYESARQRAIIIGQIWQR